jgi:FAD:protein FMN transferase
VGEAPPPLQPAPDLLNINLQMIYKIEFQAMGCHIGAALETEPQNAVVLEQVPQWFEEWEAALSRFRANSELCQLNQHSGQPFQVSSTLWKVLRTSQKAYQQSGGLVTPVILDALEMAGYDRSFDLGLSFAPNDMDLPPLIMPLEELVFNPRQQSVTLPLGMRLDFGGIAKGWAAHQAMQRLTQYGSALVDAGGDIAISDVLSDGQFWPIAVTDPLNETGSIALLKIGHHGVATSGKDYRRWKRDDLWYHHIINPLTGRPAQTDLLTVTIIAPDAMQAEMAAKTVFILGQRDGLLWLKNQPQMAALLVLQDGAMVKSPNLQSFIWQADQNIY